MINNNARRFFCSHPYVEIEVSEADCRECEYRGDRKCRFRKKPSLDDSLDVLCEEDEELRGHILKMCRRFLRFSQIVSRGKKTRSRMRHRRYYKQKPDVIKKQVEREFRDLERGLLRLLKLFPDLSKKTKVEICQKIIDDYVKHKEMEFSSLSLQKITLDFRPQLLNSLYERCKVANPELTENKFLTHLASIIESISGTRCRRQNLSYHFRKMRYFQ